MSLIFSNLVVIPGSGIRSWILFVGKRFPCLYRTEHDFACQSGTDFAFGNCIRHLDGNRSGWYGFDWDIRFQGTCHSHPAFLPLRAHCILDRIESGVILKEGDK